MPDVVALNQPDPKMGTERIVSGPSGAKPKRIISPRNIMLYGTLFVVAAYYLLPLYVMIVTSLKGISETSSRRRWKSPLSPGPRPGRPPAPG